MVSWYVFSPWVAALALETILAAKIATASVKFLGIVIGFLPETSDQPSLPIERWHMWVGADDKPVRKAGLQIG
jgi:hypothetical protein